MRNQKFKTQILSNELQGVANINNDLVFSNKELKDFEKRTKGRKKKLTLFKLMPIIALFLFIFLLSIDISYAASSSGIKEIDNAFDKGVNFFGGKVALGILSFALLGLGFGLVFSEDIRHSFPKLPPILLGGGVILGIPALISFFFGSSATIVSEHIVSIISFMS